MDKNIFDILTDNAINERLNDLLLQDNEYQKIQEEISNLIEQFNMLNLPKEQMLIVDKLLSAHTDCGCYYGRITYQQGFRDCTLLLREMELIKSDADKGGILSWVY